MATSWNGWCWQLGVASLLGMGGALAASGNCALAQITPDGSLGAESSIVTPTNIDGLSTERIDGGATRGVNLFHSFEQFSIPTGGAAYFSNAIDIQNIISRVTGRSVSNIDGLIRAKGTANLFLLNPNGIIFGPNASLSIGGSFLASTASSINFANDTQFSATAPPPTPLLTISVPLGLQYGWGAGGIQVQGSGLQVRPGQTLALMGGSVSVEGGKFGFLSALRGRIELGGLAGAGMVEIEGQQSEGAFRLHSLRLPDLSERADVLLTNNAFVNVAAGGGGSIAINARNIHIEGSSILRGGIQTNLGFSGATAGDIRLNATGEIALAHSGIFNNVRTGAMGDGGSINITTGSLSVTDGAQLIAVNSGQGNAGSVTITASDAVIFDGISSDGNESGAFSTVEEGAIGNAGGINITTGSLSVTDGAQLNVGTSGQGDAGSVNINAHDTVSFNGSDAFTNVRERAVGNGGDINITTGTLYVTNGAQLQAGTFGQGDAGNVTINARDTVSFNGGDVSSNVEEGVVGNGGDINITTGSLFLTNVAALSASTFGEGYAGSVAINARDTVFFDGDSTAFSYVGSTAVGNGGSINITAGSLSMNNAAQLQAVTLGKGNAGNVNINVRDIVSFDGVSSDGAYRFTSGPFTSVESGAMGNGGNINIIVGSLYLTNGAQLVTVTEGRGNAGSVTINARDTVSFDGVSSSYGLPSGAFSDVDSEAVGNGGGINITTRSLSVTDGALLSASTLANTSDNSTGQGGDLNITTGQLVIQDGAELTVSSTGSGRAGNLRVKARSIQVENQGAITATSRLGSGGDITLQAQDLLLLRRESNISTRAGTAQADGNGGNIDIKTKFLVAVPSENSDITADAYSGNGGNIQITAQGIFGTQFRDRRTLESDTTASSEFGVDGVVEINTPDVDPSRGLATLPAQLVEASGLIATGCAADGENKFIVTGRGGKPPNPGDTLRGEAVLVNWATLDPEVENVENRSDAAFSTNPTRENAPTQIVEAQGWVINNKGEVVLTAHAPNVTPNVPWMTPASCHTP